MFQSTVLYIYYISIVEPTEQIRRPVEAGSEGGQVARMPLDEDTIQTLKRIREDLELDQDIEEEVSVRLLV